MKFRVDVHGEILLDELPLEDGPGGVAELVANGMRLGELLADTICAPDFPDFEDGQVTVCVTDTETGERAYYERDGKWKSSEIPESAPTGFMRVLSAAVQRNGSVEVTSVLGEMSVEDFREFITRGFRLRLASASGGEEKAA